STKLPSSSSPSMRSRALFLPRPCCFSCATASARSSSVFRAVRSASRAAVPVRPVGSEVTRRAYVWRATTLAAWTRRFGGAVLWGPHKRCSLRGEGRLDELDEDLRRLGAHDGRPGHDEARRGLQAQALRLVDVALHGAEDGGVGE